MSILSYLAAFSLFSYYHLFNPFYHLDCLSLLYMIITSINHPVGLSIGPICVSIVHSHFNLPIAGNLWAQILAEGE